MESRWYCLGGSRVSKAVGSTLIAIYLSLFLIPLLYYCVTYILPLHDRLASLPYMLISLVLWQDVKMLILVIRVNLSHHSCLFYLVEKRERERESVYHAGRPISWLFFVDHISLPFRKLNYKLSVQVW